MSGFRSLLCCALAAAAVAGGCSTKHVRKDELGAKEAALGQDIPGYAVPLELQAFNVDSTEGGYRGVFLRLSRVPTSVVSSVQSSPARIIVDMQGPTGTESAEEVFPGGDSLITHVGVSRSYGWLRVVLDLDTDQMPEYAVFPMADWVMVRIKPSEGKQLPWAHRS
jgi:hypothetical protein